MRIIPKTLQEAEDMTFNIFLQGDMRNFDSFYLKLVADFIFNKAISIEKESFSFKEIEYDKHIPGPQKIEKQKALQILKDKNLKIVGFEMPFLNYQADILAEMEGKKVIVECGPCRLWKAISCLEEGAELWIIREEEQTALFILTKGENWGQKLNEFKLKQQEELKKVKNPLDEL